MAKDQNPKKKTKKGSKVSALSKGQSSPSLSVQRNANNKKRARDDDNGGEAQWSKSKKKRMRFLKAKQTNSKAPVLAPVAATEEQDPIPTVEEPSTATATTDGKESNKQSSLQVSYQERLSGSRFRILNEELYTTTSQAAFERFSRQPELFDEYHIGFRHQVEHWPVNPVQVLVEKVKQQQEQDKTQSLVVADFGCGDAELAHQLLQSNNNDNDKTAFTVHSFDLVARGPHADLITACDCAGNIPLPAQSVDVGIFCLSLMGTNLADFVREAHRVLRADGRLHIAEVRSRFENNNNNNSNKNSNINKNKNSNPKKKQQSRRSGGEGEGGEDDKDPLHVFLVTLERLGFTCVQKDRSNKMFVVLELKKNGKKPKKALAFTAKPCIYKRR